jgi:glycosyltransferase involved in cell wall biosynthesis
MQFSIVTVSFNSGKTIAKTIESVLAQTFPPKEYFIIDGKSSDDTVAVAQAYRFRFEKKGIDYVVLSEADDGIYDAMNKGIKLATGDYIGLINSDDWYELDALEKTNRYLESNKRDLVFADLRVIRNNRSSIKHAKLDHLPSTRHWNHPTMFVSKELYSRYQYRNKSIYDDWDLVLRIRKAGYDIGVIHETLANFAFGGVSNQKSFKKAMQRVLIKNRVYRQNGYRSPIYLVEGFAIEMAKYLLG